MPRDLIIEPAAIDLTRVICDQAQLRQFNPQRFEMEQITAVCFEDRDRHICVGYKDVQTEDFWVRGHMPGMPLMPGVVMVESAAQLCSYYVHRHNLLGPGVLIGLGGLEQVRFRGPVRPGDRMLIAAMLLKKRMGVMCVCQFQCFVSDRLVCEGQIKGVALPTEELQQSSS